MEGIGKGLGIGRRNGPNNACTCEEMNKKKFLNAPRNALSH
jgi:hypothetical protein